MVKGERRGCIRLRDAFVGYDNEDDITFTITVDEKTFHLQSKNLDEREKWVSRIERTIRLHSSKNVTSAAASVFMSTDSDLNKSQNSILASSINSTEHFNPYQAKNNCNPINETNLISNNNCETLNEEYLGATASSSNTSLLNKSDFIQFDSSLTESDAYLQLLIEQLKGLEIKKSSLLNEKSSSVDAGQTNEPSTSAENANEIIKENSNSKEQDLKTIDSVINATEVRILIFISYVRISSGVYV
jgi:hypothetical protein